MARPMTEPRRRPRPTRTAAVMAGAPAAIFAAVAPASGAAVAGAATLARKLHSFGST